MQTSTGQTFQTICRLSPTQPHKATLTLVNIEGGDDVLVISTGNNLVYLVQNDKIKVIVDVHSSVIKVSKSTLKEYILIATEDGKLWTLPFNRLEYPSETSGMASSDNDIFDDLLMSDQSEMIVSDCCPVSKCLEQHLVHWQQGLQDVSVTDHYVMILTRTEELALSIYQILHNNSVRPLLLSPLQFCIQLTPNGLTDNTNITILQCLCPDITTQTCTTLERELFRSLFQTDSDTVVILFGQDSGAVSYLALPNLHSPTDNKTTPKILCHLEQAVVAVFVVCLSESVIPDTLVFVGALGKVVLVSAQEHDGTSHGTRSVQFRQYHVPGPVMASAQVNNKWFYSTLKEMYYVTFDSTKQSDPNEQSLPLSLSPVEIKVPKVCGLTFNKLSSNHEEISLYCLKLDGRVLRLSTSFTGLATKPSGPEYGSSIKQYLAEIERRSGDVENLATEIRELDDFIKKLNIATHVFCAILKEREKAASLNQETNCGIAFRVATRYQEQGACPPRVVLDCELANGTKHMFTPCWYMIVRVQTKQPWFNDSGQNVQTSHHSVPLSSLSINQLSVALDQNISFISPIEVSCFVFYDVKSLIGCKLDESGSRLNNGYCVVVKDVKLTVLSFLRTLDSSLGTIKIQTPCQMFQNTLRRFNSCDVTEEAPLKSSVRSIYLSQEAVSSIKLMFDESGLVEKSVLKNIPDEQCILRFLLSGSEKYLKWPENPSSNFIVVQTADGCEVRFQVVRSTIQSTTEEDHRGSFEVRVFSSHEELNSAIHSALLDVLKPVIDRNSGTDFKTPARLLQRRLAQLKGIQTKFEILRTPDRNSGRNTVEDDKENHEYLEKVMVIFRELREIPSLIF